MDVKIYRPGKNAMQSGRGKTKGWVLEYEGKGAGAAEPLMGWSPSEDTLEQVRLNFESKEDALAFAEKKGWDAFVMEEQFRRIKPRNYGDNFKYVPHDESKKA